MKTLICVMAICFFIGSEAGEVRAQLFAGALSPGENYKEAVNRAKERILASDIGIETGKWIDVLKENNIKLKLIFDEEGFGLMVSFIRLAKRLINEGGVLTYDDSVMLVDLMNAVSRLGAPPSEQLREKVLQRLSKSINKDWDNIVNTFCGSTN